jgi:hypothetical protein
MNPDDATTDDPTIQRTPGAQVCCDPAGRLCALAIEPVPLSALIRRAVVRGEGTESQLRARVDDMLASGLLIELTGD